MNKDLIRRQDAMDAFKTNLNELIVGGEENAKTVEKYLNGVLDKIKRLPSAQSKRDIPVKPVETTDRAWGIPHKQAVCPKCDYYLGHVAFLDVYKGKRITYCETCGQAIDWEGWKFDD